MAASDSNVIAFGDQRLPDRFWLKVITRQSGCWEWLGAKYSTGYGIFTLKHKGMSAHRFAYIVTRGDIAPGIECDHLCRNRLCVNPNHIELVTGRENILRGEGTGAKFARRTHCNNGHALTGNNVRIRPNSSTRVCKTCAKQRTRPYLERRKAAYAASLPAAKERG